MLLRSISPLIRKSVFSKSLVLAFVLQIFAVSMCTSFAHASEHSLQKSMPCHTQSLAMDMQDSHSSMAPCAHCDTLDMQASLTSLFSMDHMNTVMIAIVDIDNIYTAGEILPWVQQRAPPQPLERPLYLTTQRIRI